MFEPLRSTVYASVSRYHSHSSSTHRDRVCQGIFEDINFSLNLHENKLMMEQINTINSKKFWLMLLIFQSGRKKFLTMAQMAHFSFPYFFTILNSEF